MRGSSLKSLFAVLAACCSIPALAIVQDMPDDKQDAASNFSGMDIVVTAMRARQGGAQDIRHFRSIAFNNTMPRPESLTVEGLMGEHNLELPAQRACAQTFCLVTEAMPAALPTRPGDRFVIGLGFASNIDAKKWRREPLDLVAVVDKSGSMSGEPLELVRRSLMQILGQMRDDDRISIILYGDTSHVYLPPTDVGEHRDAIWAAIRDIASAGSTYMEAGLRLGYDTAFADAPTFKGRTRLILFTDEQPNVGRTDAESFMAMAEEASRRGIGLTTVGVGVQYDGALGSKISSVRGGNLYFISNRDEVKQVFERQLDTMVSELAHDLRLTLRPAAGYKLSGVFGVPDGLMSDAPDGAVTVTVPTAFLSTEAGGIFATLTKASDRADLPAAVLPANAPLAQVELSYVGAETGQPASDRLTVAQPAGEPSEALRSAQALIDQYLVMKQASIAFHQDGKPKEAHRLLSGLAARLAGNGLPDFDKERTLVGAMLAQAALYSGYGGELPRKMQHLSAVGTWEITRVDGMADLKRGDRLTFTPDSEMLTERRGSGSDDAQDTESYQINERQLFLTESNLVFDYRAAGDRMTLRLSDGDGTALIAMRRLAAASELDR